MRKRVALVASLFLASQSVALAQVTITGSKSQVTTNPAPQLDPSISGDIVVYTDRRARNDDIYFTNLVSGVEVAVTTDAADQRLHDISGDLIVFTDYSSTEPQAWVYDLALGLSVPLMPTERQQLEPTIDGHIVAFEVYPGGVGTNADIAIVDLDADEITLLPNTPLHEGRPTVGGSLVVFERGSGPADRNADIVVYDLATGGEAVVGVGLAPHTDGRHVAWSTGVVFDGSSDVVVYDTFTGTTTFISDAGDQTRPRLAGDVLAYDDRSTGEPDVVLLHLPTGVRHRVQGALGAQEFLNDIDGNRLVFTSDETGNFDIFLFEFEISGDEPPPPVTDDPCESTSGLTAVFSETFVREIGKPELSTHSFGFDSTGYDVGAVVVENEGCASAVIALNGEQVLSPEDFNREMQCDFAGVSLLGDNALDVELRSKPGCEVTITVYAVNPDAAAAADEGAALTCDSSSASSAWPFASFALLLLFAGRRRRR